MQAEAGVGSGLLQLWILIFEIFELLSFSRGDIKSDPSIMII